MKCTAPQYVDFVMSSVQKLVTDEDVFPTKYGASRGAPRASRCSSPGLGAGGSRCVTASFVTWDLGCGARQHPWQAQPRKAVHTPTLRTQELAGPFLVPRRTWE